MRYQHPASEVIKALKFRGRLEMAQVMARRMVPFFAKEVVTDTGPIDWLVPVPLHFLRRWSRGFNQSELIAKEMSRLIGVPTLNGILKRIKRTRQQTLLDPTMRRRNVEGAFAAMHPGPVRDRSVLLIDDVFTSGATANDCARALREAGAAGVHVFTFARA